MFETKYWLPVAHAQETERALEQLAADILVKSKRHLMSPQHLLLQNAVLLDNPDHARAALPILLQGNVVIFYFINACIILMMLQLYNSSAGFCCRKAFPPVTAIDPAPSKMPPKPVDLPTASLIGVAGKRWSKQAEQQSHTDRFKNSRALFEKLEKENSAPVKPPIFKAGTSFAFKSKDFGLKSSVSDKPGVGDQLTVSANPTQVRKTNNFLKSLDVEQKSNGPSNNVLKKTDDSEMNGASNESNSYGSSNGKVSDKPEHPDNKASDHSDSEVFIEPRSEPAISNYRAMFSRKLSSDVLPKPYHPPSSLEIRPVRRPTSTSRQDAQENGDVVSPVEALPKFSTKPTATLEKSLSKDDIAASLAAADKYLNKINSSSGTLELSNDDEAPWRSKHLLHSDHSFEKQVDDSELKGSERAEPLQGGVDLGRESEEGEAGGETDDSVSYDNVADVLSELQASGHYKADNTQTKPTNVQTRSNITDTSHYTGTRSENCAAENSLDYDSVTSTQSVYLQSKVEHTYNNINFNRNKKRVESNSDEDQYETVAPPSPPIRTHPANLPLDVSNEPEPMSVEEAQNLLSTR